MLIGTNNNDTFTGAKDAIDATDKLIDSSTTDNDTATLVDDANLGAITISNIENVSATIQTVTTAATLDAANYSGVKVLTVNRGDVVVAGSTLAGGTQLTVNNLDAAKVLKVTTAASGNKITVLTVNQGDVAGQTAGVVVEAAGVTGNVTVDGAASVTANDSTATIAVDGLGTNTSQNSKATSITAAKAVAIDVGQTTALTGAVTINAAVATDVRATVAGGATISVKGETGTAGTDGVRLTAIDDSGVTLTTSYAGTSTASGAISLTGGTGNSDTATVKAAGIQEIKLTDLETITLEGNGAEVTFNVDNASTDGGVSTFTVTGTQTVNLAGEDVAFNGKTVTGVNTLTIDALDAVAAALNLSKISAAKIKLGVDQAQNKITVADNQTLEINTATQTTGLDIDFAATTTTGNLKIISGDVNGAANTAVGTATVGVFDAAAASDTVVGTVTLEAFDSNFTATTSTTLAAKQTLVITGDEDVTLATVAKALAVDASASSGIISLTTSAGVGNITTGAGADQIILNDAGKHTVVTNDGIDTVTITATANETSVNTGAGNDIIHADETDVVYVVSGGAGDDSITATLGNANDDMDAYFDGGDGTDTLTFDSAIAHDFSTDGSTAGDTDIDKFVMASIEKINITALNAALTVTDTQFANNKVVQIIGDSATDVFKVTGVNNTSGATIDASGLTVSGTVTVQYTGSAKADTITGGVANETFIQTAGADSIDGGTGTNTYQLAGATTESGSSNASTGSVVNLSASAITSASVFAGIGKYFGDSVTSVAAGTVAHAYDAEDSSTVNNSAVVDAISNISNVVGSALKDYIVGNSSDNVITGNGGADYINTGDGNDTVVYLAKGTGTALAEMDTIASYAQASDTINFQSAAGTPSGNFNVVQANDFTAAAVDVSAAGSLDAAITIAINATDADNTGTEAELNWFEYSGNTYVVYDHADDGVTDGGLVTADDFVIKLVGTTLGLTAADFTFDGSAMA